VCQLPLHGVESPVAAKSRQLEPGKLAAASREFKSFEKASIVHRSNSPWSSPLHMVPNPRMAVGTHVAIIAS
jgi:hypothetical protein